MIDKTPIIGKDISWNDFDGRACRVVEFYPYGKVESDQIKSVPNFPYASLLVEIENLNQKAILYITNKVDFVNLWKAYKERGINKNEEVLLFWSNKHYKIWAKFFSVFMPKIWLMVCKNGAYELMINQNYEPKLKGEARALAIVPLAEWKPKVMK